jgi:alanyl-tRNA synthetase
VIADHSRAVTFLIADGVLPSNEGRGYVLRRILRRAVRHGRLLGRREPFMAEAAAVVIDVMGEAYPHLAARRDQILEVIGREEAQFARTLDAGSKMLDDSILRILQDRAAVTGMAAVAPAESRAVGRRPEDLPSDAPQLAGQIAF